MPNGRSRRYYLSHERIESLQIWQVSLVPTLGGGGGILCLHGGVSCAHKGSVLCPHGEYLVPPLVHTGGVSHTHRRDSIVCTGECLHVLCAQAKIVLASVCPHIHASQSWEEQMVTLQQMTFDIM